MRKSYVWSLLLCLLGSFVCQAAEPVVSPTKLAVVDVGPQEKVPPAFMDLMLVGLGNQPQLAMLERTELNKLLREQTLSLRMGEPVKSADAVKAGQLWAVDAFLMLEVGKPSDKKEIPVRVRLVDAHYGLKLWDGTILLSPDTAKYQESIDLVVKRSVKKLALLSQGATGVVLVAVAPVRSEEMSSRWDWLKDPLTIGIEQNIGVTPGFLLVERERTRSLTDERQVTAGLPEALRASAVFVDSSYKINREKGPDVVTLQLRCRRGGSTLLETTVDGTVSNTVELCRNAAREVATKLGVKPADNSMAAQQEAAMLVAEAQVAFSESSIASRVNDNERSLGAHRRAFALMAAAVALEPDSCEYQRILLRAGPTAQASLDNLVADAKALFPVARRFLQHCQPEKTHFQDVLFGLLIAYPAMTLQREHPEVRNREEFKEVVREFWGLWQTVYEMAPLADRGMVLGLSANAHPLCLTVDDAIENFRKSINYYAAMNASNPVYVGLNSGDPLRDPIARPKIVEFLDELMISTNPAIRYLGLGWGVGIYKKSGIRPDEARAQAIAKEHVALMKSEKYPNLGAWHSVLACTFSADVKIDCEKKASLYEDIIHWGIQRKLYVDNLALENAEMLAGADKGSEGVAFLEQYIANLPAGKGDKVWLESKLRDLRRRVPDQSPSAQPGAVADALRAQKLLTFYELINQKPGEIPQTGLRLFMQGNVAVVVYFYRANPESGYGVLRFDMDRQKVIADQRAGQNARMSSSGPAVAHDGHNVFVAHPHEGILVFPSDGQPRLLNEENGLASQHILSLEVLDGKLYAIIGASYEETGVMEVDWKSGTSRILWSKRSKSADSPLAGRNTPAILTDSNRHLIWVVSDDGSAGVWMKNVSLFTYSPRDNRIDLKQKDFDAGIYYSMSWTEGSMLISEDKFHRCWVLNPETVKGETFYGKNNAACPVRKQANNVSWHMPDSRFPTQRSTFIGGDLLAFLDRELLWLHAGVVEPEYLLDRLFSKELALKINVCDLAPTKQGLLLLSTDGLYLVPEIKGLRPPSATQSTELPVLAK